MWACCLLLDLLFCILSGSVLYDSIHNGLLVRTLRKLLIITLFGFVSRALLRFFSGTQTIIEIALPDTYA